MVDYRSILRLHSQGNSQREIEREINIYTLLKERIYNVGKEN